MGAEVGENVVERDISNEASSAKGVHQDWGAGCYEIGDDGDGFEERREGRIGEANEVGGGGAELGDEGEGGGAVRGEEGRFGEGGNDLLRSGAGVGKESVGGDVLVCAALQHSRRLRER